MLWQNDLTMAIGSIQARSFHMPQCEKLESGDVGCISSSPLKVSTDVAFPMFISDVKVATFVRDFHAIQYGDRIAISGFIQEGYDTLSD